MKIPHRQGGLTKHTLVHGLRLFDRATRYSDAIGPYSPKVVGLQQTDTEGNNVQWLIGLEDIRPDDVAYAALARGSREFIPTKWRRTRLLGHHVLNPTGTALKQLSIRRVSSEDPETVQVLTVRNAQLTVLGGAFEGDAVLERGHEEHELSPVARDALMLEFLDISHKQPETNLQAA